MHLLWTHNDQLVVGEAKNLHTLLIYICTSTFGLFLLWDAYIVGVMSPATAIVLISVIALGLLLFEAKVIYPILSLAILIIITIAHATLNGKLSYAPIFDFPGMHNSPYTNQNKAISITASFGVPVVCHEQSMRQAIKQADDAMYQAKRLGRNLIVLSDQTEGAVAIPVG